MQMSSFALLCFLSCFAQTSGLVVAHAGNDLKRHEAGTPGFGLDMNASVTEHTHSDGFFAVECLADRNMIHADKHGTGHLMFEPASPISIVRYSEAVPRPKWEKMTQQVCFNFCRTVKDAQFFGLFRGDECYCAPYYVKTAGDLSACDMPCAGNSAQLCGGTSKQSMFEMHKCGTDLQGLVDNSLSQCQATISEGNQKWLEAQPILMGLDKQLKVAELSGVIRESVQEIARGWAQQSRDTKNRIEDAQKAYDDLNATVAGEVDLTLGSTVAKVEAAQMVAQKQCAALAAQTKSISAYEEHHAGPGIRRALNFTMDELNYRQMPAEWNRMPDWALQELGCDSDPSDGCTGFDLTYWIAGRTLDDFEEHYDNGTMQENGMNFAWLCYEYCKASTGCVAADVYGTDNTFACRMLSSVSGTRLAKTKEKWGYSFDNGFILNNHFLTPAQDTFKWYVAKDDDASRYTKMIKPVSLTE